MQKLLDKFVVVNGHKIHYIESGDGFPVLLFHGARFNAETWVKTNTVNVISTSGYKAISVDFPGFGSSERIEGISLSEFINLFMKTLGINKAILLGASMGGEAVLEFSLKYTEFVSGLILVGAVGVEEFEDQLSKLNNAPLLLIWGSHDTVSPKRNYELILNKLRNARLEIIGKNHACYLDDPNMFNDKLISFLKGMK
ncbi:alpha/beta fold hydrolase [Sulfolobus sp. E5-1-F]|uniref:alpha/beta fold hydrolase n=1 Tax=Sulfolobaceae TaxID=118883 RepID=UPI0012969F00|nr:MULTISPECIES: alpha/beta hydrolase [unclassified Sulfolobus]QGA53426.1 alpha/beta fold hydrolase [Sulfolobus sp. E5-1-F]QGA68527.1 alpha/beta fold hydrolase [Sulfolobus sp. E11-6]